MTAWMLACIRNKSQQSDLTFDFEGRATIFDLRKRQV
jgi:hypothetical protein